MRFAVLFHELPPDSLETDHFDLLLEDDGQLLTWRLPVQPLLGNNRCFARQLTPHRLHYLTYEGPISGNRGNVRRVAAGTFQWQSKPDGNSGQLRAVLQFSAEWELKLTPSTHNHTDWVVEWQRLG